VVDGGTLDEAFLQETICDFRDGNLVDEKFPLSSALERSSLRSAPSTLSRLIFLALSGLEKSIEAL
ncbi:MAG: hypothetical protein KBS81_08065, partial [Spirochaetales bacterium]|nr:hypothetical protein [Candidatus Physcosoma equi]